MKRATHLQISADARKPYADLINRIADALGTAERGNDLVAVARAAARAEMAHAALIKELERLLDDRNATPAFIAALLNKYR